MSPAWRSRDSSEAKGRLGTVNGTPVEQEARPSHVWQSPRLRAVLLLAAAVVLAPQTTQVQSPPAWVITGVSVADGSGAPLRTANVRVVGDAIASIDAAAPQAGDQVVDGIGLVLAPGFIDVHNHSTEGLATDREAASQISQGITTVLVGPDGSSPKSIADYLAARRSNPATVNVATLVGHATVRQQVMGDDYRRTRHARRSGADGGARRPGHARWRARPLVWPRIRRGQLRRRPTRWWRLPRPRPGGAASTSRTSATKRIGRSRPSARPSRSAPAPDCPCRSRTSSSERWAYGARRQRSSRSSRRHVVRAST